MKARAFVILGLVLVVGCGGGGEGPPQPAAPQADPLDADINLPGVDTTLIVTRSAVFSSTASGGAPPYTYSWNFGGGAANTSQEDPGPVTFAILGAFEVTLTVTDSEGETAADSVAVTVTPSNDFWVTTAGPEGGKVRAFAFSATRVFAGTNRTVYGSTDGGSSWTALDEGMYDTIVHALVVDADGRVYAGTRDGLYRSTDDGQSWARNTVLPAISSLGVDGLGRVYAGAVEGVYRSTDAGLTWSRVDETFDEPATEFAVDPNGVLYAGSSQGLFRYTDTWKRIETGLDDTDIRSVAVLPDGDVFVGTRNGEYIYRSTDQGNNWATANDGTFGWWVVGIVGNASGDVFASDVFGSVYRSTDKGATWVWASVGLDGNLEALAVAPAGTLYAGTWVGAFRSTDLGALWTPRNSGLLASQVNVLATKSSGIAFAATSNGVFRSLDNGDTWARLLEGGSFAVGIDGSGRVYASIDVVGLLRSTNNGASWTNIANGMSGSAADTGTAFAFNSNGDIFFGSSFGLFRSTDDGASWTELRTEPVSAIVVLPGGDLIVSVPVAVFRSTDNGDNWSGADSGLSLNNNTIGSFAVQANGDVLATLGTEVFRSTNGGASWTQLADVGLVREILILDNGVLFVAGRGAHCSTDDGATWNRVGDGINEDQQIYLTAVRAAGDRILLGSFASVFRNSEAITCTGG